MNVQKNLEGSSLAESVMAEVECTEDMLSTTVGADDVLDSSEWTNIVAVSLDGSIICNSSDLPTEEVPENTVSLITEDTSGSDTMVMECLMLCRLCAALVQISMLEPVFGEGSDNNLREMIERLIPGQVVIDDGLPQRVCAGCIERLRSCCEILDLFKAADTRLRQMVELCNLGGENLMDNSTLALEAGGTLVSNSTLPIILQSENESTVDSLSNIAELSSNFCKEGNSLSDSLVSSNEMTPMQKLENSTVPISDAAELSGSSLSCSANGHKTPPNEEESNKCVACKQVFSDQADLLSHCMDYHSSKVDESILSHDSTNSFQCSICLDVLASEKCVPTHMLTHIQKNFACHICGEVLKGKSQLKVHLKDQHGSCGVKNEPRWEELAHNRCEFCGKEFKNSTALRKHKATHTGEKTVLCSLCGKTLANLNSLRVHMRIHSEERPFTCAECGKSFKGSSELRSHSLTHTREKIFNCPECDRKFHSKGLVRQHMLSHTHDKPHKCDMCTAAFNRLGNLNQHKKKHSQKSLALTATPFECSSCGKRFQSKLTLKYHIAKHTGDKYPFDCEICGKKFIAIDPYRVHMRIHTGERPFECEVCKKTFRSTATLKQHVASLHRDDFPFACPYCQRSFKRLQSLIVHKKTHTGEKPWLCSQCGRAFAQKGDMIKHSKTHRPQFDDEPIIMEVDTIDDLALDTEISKMIFG